MHLQTALSPKRRLSNGIPDGPNLAPTSAKQAAIEELELQGVAPSPMLDGTGTDAEVAIDPQTGKPSVRVVNGTRATSNVSMNRASKPLHGVNLNEPLSE